MDDRTPPDVERDPADEPIDGALAALLARDVVWVEAPPELEDSIVAAITAEAAAPSRADALPAAAPGDGSERAAPGPVVDLARRRRRRVLAGLASAAALIAVVAAGIVLFVRDPDRDPDVELALAATDLAPGASAFAAIDTTPIGVKLVLDVRGLPPAPAGTYYQAWVRNDDDGVSAGTFHLRGGDGEIELWAGVAIEDYPLVTVTIQEEGAGPASSGRVVLRGLVESP